MALLVLSTSAFVAAQLDALRRLAPLEIILTDPDSAVPQDVEAVVAIDLPRGLAARFPNLRFVACAGAGTDRLLAAGIPPHVPLTRAVDPVQGVRMAQYVAMAVLHWHRELPRYLVQQRAHEWQRAIAEPEERWTIGLMGFGVLGHAVAATLRGLGYPVRAWTRTPHPSLDVAMFAGRDALPAFLAGTRVLVCLLPLTADTEGLLDAVALGALPQGAYVINVSRGAVLDEAALLDALRAGHLAGAALDVYAQEPLPPGHPLWDEPRILLTPHIAAAPRPDHIARQILANLERARHGHALEHVVDRARGY
jgi:phosphoglycerate dehydrogenase-like enzyme